MSRSPFQFHLLFSSLSFAFPFQLPRYFRPPLLTDSTVLPHAVQKGSEKPASLVSKRAGKLLCIAK